VQAVIQEFEGGPLHLVGQKAGRLSATHQKGKGGLNFVLFQFLLVTFFSYIGLTISLHLY
jgi:hypothetical protein